MRLLFCLTQQKHASHLFGSHLLFEASRNLFKGEAEVLEDKDAMESRKLGCRVIPVAGFRIDMRGRQQPALVIVSKGLDGNLRERRKIANLQHGSRCRVSSEGRVK